MKNLKHTTRINTLVVVVGLIAVLGCNPPEAYNLKQESELTSTHTTSSFLRVVAVLDNSESVINQPPTLEDVEGLVSVLSSKYESFELSVVGVEAKSPSVSHYQHKALQNIPKKEVFTSTSTRNEVLKQNQILATENKDNLARFLHDIERLLHSPASHSYIKEALHTANLLLKENTSDPRLLILVTDMVSSPAPKQKNDITVSDIPTFIACGQEYDKKLVAEILKNKRSKQFTSLARITHYLESHDLN